MNLITYRHTLTKLSSHETPNSFKADFTVGQTSCKYFSEEEEEEEEEESN